MSCKIWSAEQITRIFSKFGQSLGGEFQNDQFFEDKFSKFDQFLGVISSLFIYQCQGGGELKFYSSVTVNFTIIVRIQYNTGKKIQGTANIYNKLGRNNRVRKELIQFMYNRESSLNNLEHIPLL